MTIPKGSPLRLTDRTRSADDASVTATATAAAVATATANTRKRPADDAFSALSRSPSPSRPADASDKRPRQSGTLAPVLQRDERVPQALGKQRVADASKVDSSPEPSSAEDAIQAVPENMRNEIFDRDGEGLETIATALDLSLGEVIAVCDQTIRRNVKFVVESALFQPGGTHAGSFGFVAKKVGLANAEEAKAFHEESLRPVQPFVSRSVIEGLVADRKGRRSPQDMARRSGLSQREVRQVLAGVPEKPPALVYEGWPQRDIDDVLRRVVNEKIPDLAFDMGVKFGEIMQLRDATVRARIVSEFASFKGPQNPFAAIAMTLKLGGGADEALAYYNESLRDIQPLITDEIITSLLSARVAGTGVIEMAEAQRLSAREVRSVLAQFPSEAAKALPGSANQDAASEAAVGAVDKWLRRDSRNGCPPDVETLASDRSNFKDHPAVQEFLAAHPTIASADLIHGLRVRRVTNALAGLPSKLSEAESRLREECNLGPRPSREDVLVFEERMLCLREFLDWAHRSGPEKYLHRFVAMKGLPFHDPTVRNFMSTLSEDDFMQSHVGAAINLHRRQPVDLMGVYKPLSAEALDVLAKSVPENLMTRAEAFVMSLPDVPDGMSFEQCLGSNVAANLSDVNRLTRSAAALGCQPGSLRLLLVLLRNHLGGGNAGELPRVVRDEDQSFFKLFLDEPINTDDASKRLIFFEAYSDVLGQEKLPEMKDHVLTLNLDRNIEHETVKNLAAKFKTKRSTTVLRNYLIQLQKYVIERTPLLAKGRVEDNSAIDTFIKGLPDKTKRMKETNQKHRLEQRHIAASYSDWLKSLAGSDSLVKHLSELDVRVDSDVVRKIAEHACRTPWHIEAGLKLMKESLCSDVVHTE